MARARATDKTIRMNISLLGSLRKRMNQFEMTNIVNWSAIAAGAFTNYIAKHEKENKTKTSKTKAISSKHNTINSSNDR